jgi:hypothetical protein
VLKVFPALRDGQPQHLNQVVAALRQAGILGAGAKTTTWFRQYAAAFRLYPEPAPHHIVYAPGVAPSLSVATLRENRQARVAKAEPVLDKAAVLRRDTQRMASLRKAVRSAQDGGGWATVSAVRLQLGGKAQFNVRDYGYASLTKLLQATGEFDLRDAGTPQVAVRARQQGSAQGAAAIAPAGAVLAWPSTQGRRAAMPLPVPLHALRSVLLQMAAQRVEREDVLRAVPELASGAPCALSAVAGRLREGGQLYRSQSALRIFDRFPRHFEVNLGRHPQTVRYLNGQLCTPSTGSAPG